LINIQGATEKRGKIDILLKPDKNLKKKRKNYSSLFSTKNALFFGWGFILVFVAIVVIIKSLQFANGVEL